MARCGGDAIDDGGEDGGGVADVGRDGVREVQEVGARVGAGGKDDGDVFGGVRRW